MQALYNHNCKLSNTVFPTATSGSQQAPSSLFTIHIQLLSNASMPGPASLSSQTQDKSREPTAQLAHSSIQPKSCYKGLQQCLSVIGKPLNTSTPVFRNVPVGSKVTFSAIGKSWLTRTWWDCHVALTNPSTNWATVACLHDLLCFSPYLTPHTPILTVQNYHYIMAPSIAY